MTRIVILTILLVVTGCAGMDEFVARQQQYQLNSAKHDWLVKNPWAIGTPWGRGR